MTAPLRIALIGAGDIGRTAHLPALLAHPDVELALVADPDASARERVAVAAPGVPLAADPDELAAGEDVDAWVVATPPWITPRLVRRGLEAGRFVLAEKPIATSVAAASEQLDGLPPELAARVQVGFTYRHDPTIERLQELIADGALGGPLLVRLAIYDEVDDPADREHAARLKEALEHGLPIVHDGAHAVDWLRLLLGPRELEVEHAWSLRTRPDLPADNLCGASLRHPDGHRVQLEIGWLLPALVPSVLTVRGAGGCATVDVMTLDLRVADGATVTEQVSSVDRTTRCFRRQLERFVAFCRGVDEAGAPPIPTLADGLVGLALTERLTERMEERR